MFDAYSLKARFYPIIILFFPIVVIGLFYSIEFQSIIHLLASLGLVGALTYLFSQIGRDNGKKKELNLWVEWGGTPSVQLLRIRNNHLDQYTKSRYHQKLQQICPVIIPPSITMETQTPNDADEIYTAWTRFLITHTRDTTKYQLLFKENTSYGFRRNLWGLKLPALILTIGLLIGNYLFWVLKESSFNIGKYSTVYGYSSGVLILILVFWIFIVTKNWVKIPAFSYAERLCEAIDSI